MGEKTLLGRGQCCHLICIQGLKVFLLHKYSNTIFSILLYSHSFQLSQEEQYATTMLKATEADQENTGRDWKNAVNGFHILLWEL